MSTYKEPEMEAVELENEDLEEVSGGACVTKQHVNVGKKCGGYFCVADSTVNANNEKNTGCNLYI